MGGSVFALELSKRRRRRPSVTFRFILCSARLRELLLAPLLFNFESCECLGGSSFLARQPTIFVETLLRLLGVLQMSRERSAQRPFVPAPSGQPQPAVTGATLVARQPLHLELKRLTLFLEPCFLGGESRTLGYQTGKNGLGTCKGPSLSPAASARSIAALARSSER